MKPSAKASALKKHSQPLFVLPLQGSLTVFSFFPLHESLHYTTQMIWKPVGLIMFYYAHKIHTQNKHKMIWEPDGFIPQLLSLQTLLQLCSWQRR